jgi:excisionase family DNA binding protein
MTIEEVAAHLRRHPRTIWRWIADGTLRSVRIAGSRYVLVRDVDRLLRGQSVEER